MSDSISRQAAIDALERKKDKNAKGDIGGFYNKIIQNDIDALMQLPSADPVKHGRWVEDRYYDITCSRCGNRPLFYYDEEDCDYYPCLSKVCPYCEALMDEVEE